MKSLTGSINWGGGQRTMLMAITRKRGIWYLDGIAGILMELLRDSSETVPQLGVS